MKLSNNNLSNQLVKLGLGIFFLVFGLLKFVATDWFIGGPYKGFYGSTFPVALLWFMGLVQLAIAFSFFMNVRVKIAAWIASAMLLSTTFATFPKILTTFQLPPTEAPPGFLFFAVIPLLFMAISLALKEEPTRQEETHVQHEETPAYHVDTQIQEEKPVYQVEVQSPREDKQPQ